MGQNKRWLLGGGRVTESSFTMSWERYTPSHGTYETAYNYQGFSTKLGLGSVSGTLFGYKVTEFFYCEVVFNQPVPNAESRSYTFLALENNVQPFNELWIYAAWHQLPSYIKFIKSSGNTLPVRIGACYGSTYDGETLNACCINTKVSPYTYTFYLERPT